MNNMKFTITIRASKQKVWETLWQEDTFKLWAGIIDPGTYMVGQLAEGNEVQFISAENGYGVTSLVKTVVPNEYLLLLHQADTQDAGKELRDKEWTGGQESYKLTESGDITTLVAEFDVPAEMEAYFNEAYPKALQKVKELAEASS